MLSGRVWDVDVNVDVDVDDGGGGQCGMPLGAV